MSWVVRCPLLPAECENYAVSSFSQKDRIYLFGTGRDRTSRFFVQVGACFQELTGDKESIAHRCRLVVFSGAAQPDSDVFSGAAQPEQSDAEAAMQPTYSLNLCARDTVVRMRALRPLVDTVRALSRESWMCDTFPDFKDCAVHIIRVRTRVLQFELESALHAFEMCGKTEQGHVTLENDARDPRRLHLLSVNGRCFAFRVSDVTFSRCSRGCLLAVHDVGRPSHEADLCSRVRMCTDTSVRFSTRVPVTALADLLGYLQCAALDDDSELKITLCPVHAMLRIMPVVGYTFEATICCARA